MLAKLTCFSETLECGLTEESFWDVWESFKPSLSMEIRDCISKLERKLRKFKTEEKLIRKEGGRIIKTKVGGSL